MIVNVVVSCANAFQTPATSVAIRMLVPRDKISHVSGLNSFASNTITILTPILATLAYSFGNLSFILLIDIVSFGVAWVILLLFIEIPNDVRRQKKATRIFEGTREGFHFLKTNKVILNIVVTMSLLNFFSRLTYENILSPMILARSGNSNAVLGWVNVAIGSAGILGILLGGFLADYVFEPYMKTDGKIVYLLKSIVGSGNGSGMAVMFLCTGCLGFLYSIYAYKKVNKL